MEHLKKKKSFSWRDLLYKSLLFVGTVTLIVYFLPRDGKFNYQFDINKPWKYGQLIATFDFPIYKEDAVVKREQDSLMAFFQPYYQLDKNIEKDAIAPEALKQTTWQAQMTVYNIEDEIDYTKQSILQFTNESEGIYTRTNEEDGYMWNTDFTYQVNGKIITFDNIAGPWTVMEYTGTHLVMEAYNPNKMVWTLEKMY